MTDRKEGSSDPSWVEQKDSLIEALKHISAGQLPEGLGHSVMTSPAPDHLDVEADIWRRDSLTLITWVMLTWPRDDNARAWVNSVGPPLTLKQP